MKNGEEINDLIDRNMKKELDKVKSWREYSSHDYLAINLSPQDRYRMTTNERIFFFTK